MKRADNKNGCIIQGIIAQSPRLESWGLEAGYVSHEGPRISQEEPRDYKENVEANSRAPLPCNPGQGSNRKFIPTQQGRHASGSSFQLWWQMCVAVCSYLSSANTERGQDQEQGCSQDHSSSSPFPLELSTSSQSSTSSQGTSVQTHESRKDSLHTMPTFM